MRENWKEAKLLRWGMWWHSVKRFKWPPKITRVTIWRRPWGGTDILVYHKTGGCVYYTMLYCNPPFKLFSMIAKRFLLSIKAKKTFFRKDFRA